MSSKGKRSSILKKRPSMGAGSLESSPTEATATTTARVTKRIGFKPKKSVKEFFASDETATIWCNSYELSAEGTPLHVTVNDTTMTTTMKDESGSRQDKENVEDGSRRNSINSSAWNLSVSVSEEEKRRMKSEVSMNSSVLNVTDRLTLEPTTVVAPPPRPILSQRQNEILPETSAMDVSPAKAADGRLNSPRKTIYFHPKQNMFITIDDVVSNDHKRPAPAAGSQPSPNDTDINFFGPPPPRSSNQPEPPAKVLFQTSSASSAGSMTTNPWRNKSAQTSDISAGWTSHAGIDPPPNSTNQPRYTFYNSQFEISEAWNSHPAAALKLRMLQQGLEPPLDFDDPRISGGGGGSNRNSDVDTTLAITQTVAKMLQRPSGGESRTVSLDSTRASEGDVVIIVDDDEPEAMEVTCGKETPHVDIPMQTDDDDLHQQPPSLDASVSDILLPPNALSRSRPSFIPSASTASAAVPMDESYCPSPEPAQVSKRVTLAKPVPMELPADKVVTTRQTILNQEKIEADVPVGGRVKPPVRHTVFGTQMEIVEKEEERKLTAAALPQMETIKVDLADLVFARNSIGLDLAPAVATPAEVNRPKIHRIAPRALGFNFGETPSSNVKQIAPLPPPRGTIYTSEVVEQTRVEEEDRQPRKTIVQSLDVSMASPVEETVAQKGRGTVFASEDVNESVHEVKKMNHLRPTMLFNDKLEVSKLEPRSGSLEDLRKYGQSRKTILSSGDEDVIVLDTPDVTERMPVKSSRGTLLVNGDMDQTKRTPEQLVVPKSRPTTVGTVNMEQDISPVTVPSRFTVYDGDRMDETRIKDLISPEISAQPVPTKSRQTCYNAEMDETVPIGGVDGVVASLPRKSVLQEVNMDETRGVQHSLVLQKSRQTSFDVQAMNETRADQQQVVNKTEVMDNTARSSNGTLQKTSRQTSFDVQAMNETRADQQQVVNRSEVMDNTARYSNRTLQKSRQTNFDMQAMNETRVDQQQVVNRTEVMDNTARSSNRTLHKSRQTNFDMQAMNETRVDQQLVVNRTEIMENTARSSSRTLQKSRQASFDMQAMNETMIDQQQVVNRSEVMDNTARSSNRTLQKSRQTSFDVQAMHETRVDQQQVVNRYEVMDNTARSSNRTLQKSRQTNFDMQAMNETRVDQQQFVNKTEVMDNTVRSSNRTLQKSRQTSFDVQAMNETRGQQEEMDETKLQKSRQTSFAAQTMNETARPSVVQQVDSGTFQKPRQTNFVLQDMNETGVIQQVDKSRIQEKSRQTSFDVQGMNETRIDQPQVVAEVMDNTAISSNRTLQKSRQTSFDVQAMNETRVGGQSDETNLQKSRHTSFAVQDMNRTVSPAMSQQVEIDQSLRPDALEQSKASRTLQKSRQTSFAVQDMNETRVGNSSDQQVNNTTRTSSRTRQTSFAVQDMNETKVGTDQQVVNRTEIMDNTARTSNRTLQKSRQTSFAVQDMNETGRISPVSQNLRQMDEQAWQLSRSQFGKSTVDPLEKSKCLQKSRQTSFAVEQMDETMAAKSVVVDGLNLRQSEVNMDETLPQPHRSQFMTSKSIVDPLEKSRALQKSRQTSFAVEQMDESMVGHAKSVVIENLQKSRQTNFGVQGMNKTGRVSPGQNLRQSDVNMDEASPVQTSRSQFVASKSIVDPLEQSRGLQKSRHTSFAVHQMDETLAGHAKSVLVENPQKSRQTNFTVQDINETGRVSPGQNLPLSEVEIDERVWQLSRSQFGKSIVDPLEQSKGVQKSRHTSFAAEQMDETLASHAKSVLVENLQKPRHTVFQEVDMDQTHRDFGNHLQVNDQNSQLSRLEQSRASRIPTRQTSFAVQDMNETNTRDPEEVAKSFRLSKSTLQEHQKSRPTSFNVENMDETSVDSTHLQRTTQIASPTANNLQKSRQTTFHQAEMDQTRCASPLHIEETILQSPQQRDDQHHSQVPSLFQSTTNHSTVVERPRHTTLFNDDAPIEDETAPINQRLLLPKSTEIHSPHYNLEQSIKRHSASTAASSRPRHTIYAQDSMDETAVGMPRTSNGYQLEVEEQQKRTPPPPVPPVASVKVAMSRKTVYCEDDMEQTTVGFRLRRVTEVEPVREPCPVKRGPSPKVAIPTIPSQPTRSRQTILAPQDMEQSMMQQSMEVSVIKSTPRKGGSLPQPQHQLYQPASSPARRTIMPSENIVEESFQRPIKLEQDASSASSCPSDREDYEDCSTVEMKQEKSDFSFTMPALPEDRVLRSAAVIPAYRMAPVGRIGPAPKSLVAPEELNASEFLAPAPGSRMNRIPMDELSEISGLADTSRLFRPALPVSIMAGDVSTFAIREVTEPSILQPVVAVAASVPTPVIQETPRKTSMIPVARRSRGSIFNRQSVDMDMSGVTAMDGETPEGGEKGAEGEVKPEDPVAPEPVNLNASEEDEFYDAETNPVPEVAPSIPEQSTMMHLDVNQTAAGLKTLKFIDVDELEQTAWPQQQQQKRHLSQISKSVLLEQENDPLNVSLSEDYPLKKRKTTAPTPQAKDPLPDEDKPRKSLRRVTFQPELELETVTIKKEYDTIVEADETSAAAAEESRFDPSVFIVEESDMLANESNISLVASPTAQESSSSTRTTTATTRASTSKYDNSIYREYGNLTLNMDQLGSTSYIVISDDSITAPTSDHPAPIRLTLADLPKRIRKTRESLVLNSTVASEVMYEINHELSSAAAKRTCCSFKGNCNCQKPRRTMAAVRLETVETVREAWETNFGRILESVAKEATAGTEVNDLPLDERIREVLVRPMKEALPLPCLERIQAGVQQLPEVPSVWFLSENFLKSTLSDITCSSSSSSTTSEVFTPYIFPAAPSPTALVRNRLETQGFRWFLDASCEASERRLLLRHRTLRTLLLVIQLQKSPAECGPEEHVRIERLELVECWRQYVPSTRLLAAHAEFMEIGPKNVRDVLSSMCTSTAHLLSLIVHLDSLVEQVLGKVDQLWRIVKNNGAVMEEFGTDRRLRISKYFEYQHEQSIHWNRLEVQFDAIDRIERSSVSFHRSDQHCESFFPTEQQCGKSGLQGLVFLECLLWNVEKCSVEC